MTQPTLTVELGYLSGWTLGESLLGTDTYLAEVSYDQDISDLVRSVSIRRGRQHELNRVEAGTASVMVLNQDGAMTRIPPMTAIRIRATVFGGPTDVAGLAGWYDFSDVSTLFQDTARTSPVTADAQTIKGVTDKSGNGKHLSEATNGPLYKTNIINTTMSVSRYNGTNQLLANASLTAGTAFTVFMVGRSISATTDNGRFWNWGTGGDVNLFQPAASSRYFYYQNQAAGTTDLGVAGGTTFKISSLVFSSLSTVNVWFDGANNTTLDPAVAPSTTTFRIGSDGSTFLNIEAAEVIVYTAALSSTDRSAIEHYLGTKYGITVA